MASLKTCICCTIILMVCSLPSFGGFPIAAPGTEGIPVIVDGSDPIIASFLGHSASFSNDLYLELDSAGSPGLDGDTSNDMFLFNNMTSPTGSSVSLGSFAVGTELPFRLHVNNTGFDFFTGPASRNPDGEPHARVEANWMPGTTLVSFEDLLNGPFDYNDLSFSFTNTVPEPTAISGCFLGLIAIVGFRGFANHRR